MKKNFFKLIVMLGAFVLSQSLFSYTQKITNATSKKIEVETRYRWSSFTIKQSIAPDITKEFKTQPPRHDFCVSRFMVNGQEAETVPKIRVMFCWNGKWEIVFDEKKKNYKAFLKEKYID